LPPKEFRILQLLVERHGHLVTKEQLLNVVWPDTFVTDDTVAQRMSCLRKALGGDASRLIETVSKRGYRFTADVRAQ
jgi:DNA-binding winged helix-turn-helix (wHTH) protein